MPILCLGTAAKLRLWTKVFGQYVRSCCVGDHEQVQDILFAHTLPQSNHTEADYLYLVKFLRSVTGLDYCCSASVAHFRKWE